MTHRVFGAGRGLLGSRIVVIVLAIASAYFELFSITFMWGPAGDIGIGIDGATEVVTYLEPQNTAKGIHLGDRIDVAAMPFPARGYLYQQMYRPYGILIKLPFVHNGRHRTVTLGTRKLVSLPFLQGTWTWVRRFVAMLYIATGVILVWNRPTAMLWGLAVFLIRTHDYVIGPFVSSALAGLEIFAYAVVYALGLPGLIVFAARFPDGRASRATKYWQALAATVFVYYLYTSVHDFIPLFTTRPIGDLPGDLLTEVVSSAAYLVIFIVLCVKLRKANRSRSTGLSWIVAGYGVGIVIGRIGFNNLLYFIDVGTAWPRIQLCQLVIMLAMPASVAYSLIRHRTFELGHLANRTLVYSALTIVLAFAFVIATWAAALYLHSTLGLGTAMFVAVLLGVAFQANRGRVVRFVDRIFLPHRYEAGLALDRMREALVGTSDAKRLADEVTATLGLASVAVFARGTDGGFLRKAACGWPPGTTWHLLPDETLTRSLEAGSAVVVVPVDVDDEFALPIADARPRFALTFRRAGRVERAIFVGHYRNGARLDGDVIRSLHGVFDQAIVV